MGSPSEETAVEAATTLDAAVQAVVDCTATVRAANTQMVLAQKAEQSADEELQPMAVVKTKPAVVFTNAFAPLMEGWVDADGVLETTAALMSDCKSFGFDSSLVSTAPQVFRGEDIRPWRFGLVSWLLIFDEILSGVRRFTSPLFGTNPNEKAFVWGI